MTIKEKFMKLIEVPFKHKGVHIDMNKVEECEKIADDFAIDFAEWLLIEPEDDSMEKCTTKELLEIYKKEKGL
jgi:hypothetical protein